MADREITRAVIFLSSKKISKLGTEAHSANRGARVVTRRAAEEEERACKPLLFSHFRR
jgi:hypothetical protein